MTRKVSVVGVQTAPTDKPNAENFADTLALMDDALGRYSHLDMVVLPEYFYEMDMSSPDRIGPYPDEVIGAMRARAIMYNTYIIAGTVINRREDGKLYNTALLFDRKGEIVGSYDKIHMFDVLDCDGDDMESNFCRKGDSLFTYDADFGRIGISICYDIRFPELARIMALEGVSFLFVPSAFYSPRIDHWEKLLQALALQNSMYVTGVNLYGAWSPDHIFCGRSLIADPWGVTISQASDRAGCIHAYLDAAYADIVGDRTGSIRNRVDNVYEIHRK